MTDKLEILRKNLDGDLYTDILCRQMYSTDASVYKELPAAVVRPKNTQDLKKLISFALKENTSLIPRAAGTSMAGQCVGNGIVVDISKYFTSILELNEKEKWVRVQPGIILSELNKYLEKYSLLFGPETSTANRCMIAGMVGNNSCGLHSYVYGSTREHTLEIKALLSDGSEVVFKSLTNEEFEEKTKGEKLENKIYRSIKNILTDDNNRQQIIKEFPLKTIPRRNTGYALDLLMDTSPFQTFPIPIISGLEKFSDFNMCKLICGSEGTLAFITEIKLNLVSLSGKTKALLCIHLESVEDAMYANLIALKYKPNAIELTDKAILELTKGNIEQQKNRFFIHGEPGAVLIVEIEGENKPEIEKIAGDIEKDMREAGYGFYFPLIYGNDMAKVWSLRNAGLGILTNMPGDAKPVAVIEDTAVDVRDLPDYFKDFQVILKELKLTSTYYAHIGTGEIHIRPIINLKTEEGVKQFKSVAERMAGLVKKYNGSLSGEHGDGRLRGEFIRKMMGEHIYRLFCELKNTWDPYNIFNPGKIVNTPPMETSLRYDPTNFSNPDNIGIGKVKTKDSILDFSDTQGWLKAVEKCNGSADCRKSISSGGIMCPSYMATKDEKHTTRARANVLREFLSKRDTIISKDSIPIKSDLNSKDVLDVLDLCISCKGCKSECPSNIDMALYKAEFLQDYYKTKRIPFRTLLFAHITKVNKLFSSLPGFYNFSVSNKLISGIIKKLSGIAIQRSLPLIGKTTVDKYCKDTIFSKDSNLNRKIIIYIDEFTNYNDPDIGIKAIKLLEVLGYSIDIPESMESGRTFISKGLLKKAKDLANRNVRYYKDKVSSDTPLIGIEPSAILSFRDEYTRLVNKDLRKEALKLSKNCMLIDEFLAKEIDNGSINVEDFIKKFDKIKFHGHCHQKVISTTEPTLRLLSLISREKPELIPSSCCGMAGSFGFEKEHYDISMKIGELALFPSIRDISTNNQQLITVIAASGTSCRHQILDGTGVKAYHPVELLYEGLNRHEI